MKKKVTISVIIPVRTITDYVKETVSFLRKQTFKSFEIIVVTDKKEKLAGATVIGSGEPTPAYKRNLAAKKAKGQILAFLDDDSYPSENWLLAAKSVFGEDNNISAVCGPALTPPTDNFYQKVSGIVWSSWLGSGGAGTYRNQIMKRREVEDFPSVNLLIRKKDFFSVGGFDINHWPGEDTKLCLDLIKKGKKIIYDPEILVFHHRRPVFSAHLKQVSRYALRRGLFARIFPETSFKIGYFVPSFFAYGLVFGFLASFFNSQIKFIFNGALILYLLLLYLTALKVFFREKNILLALAVMPAIAATHLVYGFLFPWGYLQKEIKPIPHEIDLKKKTYIGG